MLSVRLILGFRPWAVTFFDWKNGTFRTQLKPKLFSSKDTVCISSQKFLSLKKALFIAHTFSYTCVVLPTQEDLHLGILSLPSVCLSYLLCWPVEVGGTCAPNNTVVCSGMYIFSLQNFYVLAIHVSIAGWGGRKNNSFRTLVCSFVTLLHPLAQTSCPMDIFSYLSSDCHIIGYWNSLCLSNSQLPWWVQPGQQGSNAPCHV